MDKQSADKVITEYLPKIYGFAAKRSFGYDEAEELCAEMVGEVYRSLRGAEEVYKLDSYIRRICAYVYAKFVASKKRQAGISVNDGLFYEEPDFFRAETEEELHRLRREVTFLSRTRREVVYAFYFEDKSIADIAREMELPIGTVKWHLNKARNELKGGMTMERKIGTLGIHPFEAINFGHSGRPISNADAPEGYLQDKLNLNIVYSVYETPRTAAEIADELGVTPVFLEERIAHLEKNGFLVPQKGGKYTTYVLFHPETYSQELEERITKKKLEIAEILVREYVPAVRAAVADFPNLYIPGGNYELFEATAIFYGVFDKCSFSVKKDLSKYHIKTEAGSDYIAFIHPAIRPSDPEYQPTLPKVSYGFCGSMTRDTEKYPIQSWSMDSRYCSRTGRWQNNQARDYEYLYEWMTGALTDTPVNAEKINRLRERNFITPDGKVNVMVAKGKWDRFFDLVPPLPEELKRSFADFALEAAEAEAKDYPPQMRDLVLSWSAGCFIDGMVALMVLDILYGNGTFRPLTENERVTSQLIVFSDILPEA